MFGFMKRRNAAPERTDEKEREYPAAPGTEIRYSPDLIASLKEEHRQLTILYKHISERFSAEDYPGVSDLLAEFRNLLQGHLLTENVRLYIYLNHQFGHDELNSELIREFRREMDGIGKVALNFLKKYEAIGVDRELAGVFRKDFEALGPILVQRIEREETVLYPLYMPTY